MEYKKNTFVFIIGCPRSGKTILHFLLSHHHVFAWFSQYSDRWPQYPFISKINKIYKLPLFFTARNSIINKHLKILPEPVEAWNIWKRYAPIFGHNMGSLTENDVTQKDKQQLRSIFVKHLEAQNKNMFITDYGRPCRMLYLNEIFPECKFIHVLRDGRAVAYEILKAGWLNNITDIRKALVDVSEEYVNEWLESKKDQRIAAAIRWKIAIDEINKQKKFIKNFIQIKYEDYVNCKWYEVNRILEFLNLEMDKNLEKAMSHYKLRNMNFLFEKNLSSIDQDIITRSLEVKLVQNGYET